MVAAVSEEREGRTINSARTSTKCEPNSPLISIFTHLQQTQSLPSAVRMIYATKPCLTAGSVFSSTPRIDLDKTLFFPRLKKLFIELCRTSRDKKLRVFFSGPEAEAQSRDRMIGTPRGDAMVLMAGRFSGADLEEALGPEMEREKAVVYVCGPQTMTDEVVQTVKDLNGVKAERVFCEKWW